jgi:hypothetical protein
MCSHGGGYTGFSLVARHSVVRRNQRLRFARELGARDLGVGFSDKLFLAGAGVAKHLRNVGALICDFAVPVGDRACLLGQHRSSAVCLVEPTRVGRRFECRIIDSDLLVDLSPRRRTRPVHLLLSVPVRCVRGLHVRRDNQWPVRAGGSAHSRH